MEFLHLRGRALSSALDALATCRITGMERGEIREAFLLDASGRVIDAVGIRYDGRRVEGSLDEDEFVISCHRGEAVLMWLAKVCGGSASIIAGDKRATLKVDMEVEPAERDARLEVRQTTLEMPGRAALVDVTKPFFVGQRAVCAMFDCEPLPAWTPPEIRRPRPLPRTVLGDEHERLGAQWGPFGSATMPIQYGAGAGSIAEEHLATRLSAAVYDVSHMLPFIVRGRDARAFVAMSLVHRPRRLEPGRGYYTGLCLPDGTPQDDLYAYYLEHESATGEDVFLIVANSGHEADYWYLKAVAQGAVEIDPEMPGKRFKGDVRFASRLEPSTGSGRWSEPLCSLALQGPRSRDILLGAVEASARDAVAAMTFNDLRTGVRFERSGAEAMISYTGYTGEPVAYEIYTTQERLKEVWAALVAGGARPAGLGARDSTRQEAGFPLFGHEIGGELGIPLSGGRMKSLVSFDKPFFTGRQGALAAERERTERVALLYGIGPRKVGQGWRVVDDAGADIGATTSTSTIRPGKPDAVHAYIDEPHAKPGRRVFVTPPARGGKGAAAPGREFVVATWDKSREYPGR